MPFGCIDPKDRNEANLLLKELRGINDSLKMFEDFERTESTSYRELEKRKVIVNARLDELSG